MQAWKKTSSHLRSHSWYADTLNIDFQSLRIPQLIAEIQDELRTPTDWIPSRLSLVPAPKSQKWALQDDQWKPVGDISAKLRPLAHVALRDQIVATAILLCIADRVESKMGDPRVSIERDANRKRVLAYGHRLFCDSGVLPKKHALRHRWGSSKLYRGYFDDYQTFLRRPRVVASQAFNSSGNDEIAIVQSDISQFYDRISSKVLYQKIHRCRRSNDDPRFFDLARRVFRWRWDDEEAARDHAERNDLPSFHDVALPQGLVSAGFFANIALQDVEAQLAECIDSAIDSNREFLLLDACYYVDDFRFVLRVPRGRTEQEIAQTTSEWLQGILDDNCPGLVIQNEKTKATVEGRDRRFLVPQSRTAKRIQSEVSGMFDMLHGTELIGAIEGFFHTQRRYSSEATSESNGRTGLLVGTSDMKDETASRFAAGRFRRTFRSLRPLLHGSSGGNEPIIDEFDEDEELFISAAAPRQLVLSKEQLDERGKLFSALLIEEWTANPANVRLLRIALDIYPDEEFLDQILRLLRSGWMLNGARGAERKVKQYCLAELFRAGATETGIVFETECLPSSVDPEDYHKRLVCEAVEVFNLFANNSSNRTRLPWYLMQQVFLYLSARDSFPDGLGDAGRKGGRQLEIYRGFARFLSGRFVPSLQERANYLVIAVTGFGHDDIIQDVVSKKVSSGFLESLDEVSPSTAAAVWKIARGSSTKSLWRTAEKLGLEPKPVLDNVSRLPDIASRDVNPFVDEINLLYLAKWLLSKRPTTFTSVVSPWQIQCGLLNERKEFGRVDANSFRMKAKPRTAAHLFRPPDWCKTSLQKRRYQIGSLLRFAIRGSTSLFSHNEPIDRLRKRYQRPVSHWEQQRYSGFQGRSAFGPAWLPLSSFVENLLFELLRWPGCGISKPFVALSQLEEDVNQRLTELKKRYGKFSNTLLLDTDSRPPFPSGKKEWERHLRIGVVQSITPCSEDFRERLTDPELNDPQFRRRHKAHVAAVLESVSQLLRVRETHRSQSREDGQQLDILVFPELSIHSEDIRPLLIPFVRVHKCIVLCGMVYHADKTLPGAPLINSCQWIIPEWSATRGFTISIIEQGKKYLAKEEKAFEPRLIGFRPAQWRIKYHWHWNEAEHRPLYLSASVCYDATDLALAKDLSGENDLYIICALNKDVGAFDRMSDALHYHMFQGVLVVNNGEFGGSSFYLPLDKPYQRQVFHHHGQPQVSIAFAEISPKKLIERPNGDVDHFPQGKWKTPPAGWESF